MYKNLYSFCWLMKKWWFILPMVNVLVLCVVIFSVSVFFIANAQWMWYILILLALLALFSLSLFKISWKSAQPDILFGLIDNGILAIMAVFWWYFAGVTGAIMWGVVGNAITDGIAGFFEWHYAEKLRANKINEERTILKSAVWKMAGCLFGAGIVLVIVNLLHF
jgi:hypothetical protein